MSASPQALRGVQFQRVTCTIILILAASSSFAQTVSGVTNAASFAPEELAPGSIATIFGSNLTQVTAQATSVPLPTNLQGVTLNVGGVLAPLFYVSPTQINFQIPSGVLGGHTTAGTFYCISGGPCTGGFTVSSTAPGIFVDQNGRGIIQNQDGSLNSLTHPAATNSYVTVYLTGVGAVDNPVADGVPTPTSPLSRVTAAITVTIGGVAANAPFVGLTPAQVGLAQANVQIPNLPPGTYPLTIKIGSAVSNTALIIVSGGTAAATYLLTSILGNGAAGNPGTGSNTFRPGEVAPYGYSTASGFAAAHVDLDGPPSPLSGSIAMNSDHWLWAFGQADSGTNFSGFVTAPNDPSIIPYPQFYTNRSSTEIATITDPFCGVKTPVVAYPSSYLGSFQMPTLSGAPLPDQVLRGVAILDIWDCCVSNPALNIGCSGDMHAAFEETLARAKLLGADHVSVTTYPSVIDAKAATPVLDVANQQISSSELAFITSAAASAGLDIWLVVNIPSGDENGVPLSQTPNQQWFSGFLDQYSQYIALEAKMAQTDGVKTIMLGWRDYYLDVTNYVDAYVSKMTAALSQIRAAFDGKVIFYDVELGYADYSNPGMAAALYNGADAIMVDFVPSLAQSMAPNLSVPLLRGVFKDLITQTNGRLSMFQPKPLVAVGYIVSNQWSLVNGPVDETWDCGNCASLSPDFSVQAIGYEALFEALNESGLPLLSFETYGYWPTDVMLPQATFPAVGRTVRNKPAEAVIRGWFRK
jgi:uncharacterized protein (TIGR03437 family)